MPSHLQRCCWMRLPLADTQAGSCWNCLQPHCSAPRIPPGRHGPFRANGNERISQRNGETSTVSRGGHFEVMSLI